MCNKPLCNICVSPRPLRPFLLVLLLALCYPISGESHDAYAGRWETIDDRTGKAESMVELWIEGNELKGRVLQVYNSNGQPLAGPLFCGQCRGDLKGAPIHGMMLMWGFTKKGNKWVEGKILDPNDGNTYHCSLEIAAGGQEITVFGYIQFVVKIGRKQSWRRLG